MNSELRWWLLLLTVTTCAVLVCVYLVDRPAAEFFNLHLRHTSSWQLLDDVLESLVLAIAAALFFLLAAGCRLLSGNPLPTWSLKPLLCSFAALWALQLPPSLRQSVAALGPTQLTFKIIYMAFTGGTAASTGVHSLPERHALSRRLQWCPGSSFPNCEL